MKKIVIVGGVAGGATAAARLRRLSETDEIIMFERDEYISFANCGLPYYIGDVITDREKLIVQTKEGMGQRFNLDIRNFSEVVRIDRENKEVVVLNRQTNERYKESYDKLILSPGAKPIVPRIPGLEDATNVYTLRNIPDTDKIYNAINQHEVKHATVVGGGFIGVEMAENLAHKGISVTLVERAPQVMGPADFEMAQFIHEELTNNGVELILGDEIKEVTENGKIVKLASDGVVNTDMIVMAIGVCPETELAVEAGLDIGQTGGIKVNEQLMTSDQDIYAVGDAIEVTNFITKKPTIIPLAWPANRQGRIVADHINGKNIKYKGSLGASVLKVFDKTFASVGANEKLLCKEGIAHQVVHVVRNNHAGYYPGATSIVFKIIFEANTGKILGAQGYGEDGVEKRIDVVSAAIQAGLKIDELEDIELCYAPPYGSAKDPVNIMGYVGTNVFNSVYKNVHYNQIDSIVANDGYLLDVRTPEEYSLGHIKGSINIEVDDLRKNIERLPKDKPIYITCQVGHRGYVALQILRNLGFKDLYNLSGGYKVYSTAKKCFSRDFCQVIKPEVCATDVAEVNVEDLKIEKVVDACGLQCPGPILQTKMVVDQMMDGQVAKVTASDPGYILDIETWCKQTGNTLIKTEKGNKQYTAYIKKGSQEVQMPSNFKEPEKATLVLFSGELDKALAAMIIAQGAAAAGKEVTIFTTFWGLNALRKNPAPKVTKPAIDAMFGKMMPVGAKNLPLSNMQMAGMGKKMMEKVMKDKNVDPIDVQLQRAMNLGVKFVACTMSMDVMGITEEELIDGVTLGGVASYVGEATQSALTLFI